MSNVQHSHCRLSKMANAHYPLSTFQYPTSNVKKVKFSMSNVQCSLYALSIVKCPMYLYTAKILKFVRSVPLSSALRFSALGKLCAILHLGSQCVSDSNPRSVEATETLKTMLPMFRLWHVELINYIHPIDHENFVPALW